MKYLLFALILGAQLSFCQEFTQNIRGKVIDTDSKEEIIGANVVLLESSPIIGTATDVYGEFRLENIPVGRVSIEVSFIGYEPKVIPNILLTSGKEVQLSIEIQESFQKLSEVTIGVTKDKKETVNDLNISSTRTLSVEESKRFAGSFSDPARLVASYAGVTGNQEGNNDIIVRGNSPKGILWRLEGIEIPNPNHFSDEGSTGGPINALNSNMLATSDFLTGAFSPEYGNAYSGVFDMKLRTGNPDKKEYSFGFGVLGTDFTLEGPFKTDGKASYLANYRYSSLAILDNLGVVDFGGVPKYQDGSFKVVLPSEKLGTFSLFGLGGYSNITEEYSDSLDHLPPAAINEYQAHMGVVGLNHTKRINKNAYQKSSLAYSRNGSSNLFRMKPEGGNDYEVFDEGNFLKESYILQTSYNHKFNVKNTLKVGGILTYQDYGFFFEYRDEDDVIHRELDINTNSSYTQAYATWKHRFSEDLTFVGGVHHLHFQLNNSQSLEPRAAFQWNAGEKDKFNLGYGRHSKIESLLNYTSNVSQSDGSIAQSNMNLKLPKADHFVLGWDHSIGKNSHIKLEAYYQGLSDVIVEDIDTSTFSLINSNEWYSTLNMVNAGKGRNYGFEMTLERFFADNFFYLATASVYRSEYKTILSDWLSTRYDANYATNFLFGKEFKVGKKENLLGTSIKLALLGGNRYHPIDLEESQIQDRHVIDRSNPWGAKGDDIFYTNISAYYKINKKKASHEIKLEVLNATNNQAATQRYYNSNTDQIEEVNQLGLIPNIMYMLNF